MLGEIPRFVGEIPCLVGEDPPSINGYKSLGIPYPVPHLRGV
jgi:hypothetical protein